MASLLDQRYDVFAPVFGNGAVDLIASRPGEPALRIEVKSSIQRTKWADGRGYKVSLKRQKAAPSGAKRVEKFDSTKCDIVAVWLPEEDCVLFFPAAELHDRYQMTVRDDPDYYKVPRFTFETLLVGPA